jgi:hypothetical protein
MSDLSEFVAARLDEDERAADAVVFACRDSRQPWPPEQAPGRGGPALTAYLEHFSEDRAVRDVAAKRAILAEYTAVRRLQELTRTEKDGYRDWVLCHLAAVWSDHPDYRPEWKP